jgi:hypothetical protein
MVTSTQDKTCDTKKFLNGNPIPISMATQSTVNATNVLYNASEFFYNINVPTNIFSQGYIDMELECPSATARDATDRAQRRLVLGFGIDRSGLGSGGRAHTGNTEGQS